MARFEDVLAFINGWIGSQQEGRGRLGILRPKTSYQWRKNFLCEGGGGNGRNIEHVHITKQWARDWNYGTVYKQDFGTTSRNMVLCFKLWLQLDSLPLKMEIHYLMLSTMILIILIFVVIKPVLISSFTQTQYLGTSHLLLESNVSFSHFWWLWFHLWQLGERNYWWLDTPPHTGKIIVLLEGCFFLSLD